MDTDPSLNLDIQNSGQAFITSKNSANPGLGKVAYVGLTFGILYTAFNGFQGLIVQTYNDLGYKYMGELTLLVQYIVTLVALFISPTVVKGWSYKFGITLPSLGFITPALTVATINSCAFDSDHFWCSGAVMNYLSNVASAVGIGISVPAFWLSLSRYVNSFTNAENKGKYYGVFWSFIAASQIFGNLLSYLLIQHYGRTVYFIVCAGFGLATTLMLLLSAPAPKYHEEWAGEGTPVKAKRILGLALNTKIKYLLPFIFFAGLVATLNNVFQYKTVLNAVVELGNKKGYFDILIFMLQGFFGVLACYLAGRHIDLTAEKHKSLNIWGFTYNFAVIFSLLAYFLSNLGLAYVMGSLWGFGFSGAFVLIFAIVAKEFDGTIEIFAVVQIAMTLGAFVGAIMGVVMLDMVPGVILVSMVFMLASQVGARFFKVKEESHVRDQL